MGFPKFVYKCGTGKKLSDDGLFTAESKLVTTAEALAELGLGWCDSPVEAAAKAPEPKAEEKPAKKVK